MAGMVLLDSTSENLRTLNATRDTLTTDEERSSFMAYFIGVLAGRVTEDEWKGALEHAREYLETLDEVRTLSKEGTLWPR
jgi:hypothetical protein